MPLPTRKTEKEKNHLKKKYLFYGRPKSGKTTFAANFGGSAEDESLFFCAEPGHSFVEIYKYERTNPKSGKLEAPQNWMDFVECCRELYDTDSHNFSLLVIDTVDILWQWCTKYICDINEINHPSEMGFGKAYQAISAEFSKICNTLGQRGIGFIFISHEKEYEAQIGPTKQTCITTTLPAGAAKFTHGFVDYIWYFHQTPEGKRMILTDRSDNINAGSRGDVFEVPLPLRMPMNPEYVIGQLNKSEPAEKPMWSVGFDEDEEIDI